LNIRLWCNSDTAKNKKFTEIYKIAKQFKVFRNGEGINAKVSSKMGAITVLYNKTYFLIDYSYLDINSYMNIKYSCSGQEKKSVSGQKDCAKSTRRRGFWFWLFLYSKLIPLLNIELCNICNNSLSKLNDHLR